MPKLNFVKSARKDNPVAKKGESYYWWKFAFGPKQYSKERPHRSRLTQSSFKSAYWTAVDEFFNAVRDDFSDLRDQLETLKDTLQELRDEAEESRENMPEHLQDVGSGEVLMERIDNLEQFIDGIETAESDIPEDDDENYEDESARQEKIDEIVSEVQSFDFE